MCSAEYAFEPWTDDVPSQFQGEIYGNHKYSCATKMSPKAAQSKHCVGWRWWDRVTRAGGGHRDHLMPTCAAAAHRARGPLPKLRCPGGGQTRATTAARARRAPSRAHTPTVASRGFDGAREIWPPPFLCKMKENWQKWIKWSPSEFFWRLTKSDEDFDH